MKLFGIMLVKDEADIIASTLRAAEPQFDRIIVVDNGSADGTWEIVRSMESGVIVPWRRDLRPYSNELRADAFDAFRGEAEKEDWWCYKMDADEIYVDEPRAFLSTVPSGYHTVYKRSVDYVLTDRDVEEHDFAGDFEVDRPYIRYIQPRTYTEPRFFRYRQRLLWKSGTNSPRHMGIRWHRPITLRHFQWRSPQQIQHRLDLRRQVRRTGANSQFRHITAEHWRDVIADHQKMILDDGTVRYEDIPLSKNLRLPPHKLLLRRFLHKTGIFP